MKHPPDLRKLLKKSRPILACGVYDGLSARLAERAGFDALWASGFCVSASKRLPDAGLLTMSEHLAATREIRAASSLPVIADVDDGFGDAVNVCRTVREYEAAGAAAICLEDNRHPKRSSLYAGVKRALVRLEEFADKIRAARQARSGPAFLLIARTEALIAQLGLSEALRRARAYAKAGADMILVHSKEANPSLVLEFGRAWNLGVPLVAVPTTYARVKAPDLYRAGYRVVIFANQGLRAAASAMDRTFRRIRRAGSSAPVEKDLSSLQDIDSLVDVDAVRRLEARFMAAAGPAESEAAPAHVGKDRSRDGTSRPR